jgi:hypothetical protein
MPVSWLSVEDIETRLNQEFDAGETAQVEALIEGVAATIYAAIGKNLDRRTETVDIPGTWSEDLELPGRPIVSVGDVRLNGRLLDPSLYSYNQRQLLRRATDEDLFDTSWDELGANPLGGARARLRPLHWGGPASTVRVTYTHGYASEDIPPLIKYTAIDIAARAFVSPVAVKQESLGTYSVTYLDRANGEGSGIQMTETEAKMLRSIFRRGWYV